MILPPKPKTLDEAWDIIKAQAEQIDLLQKQVEQLMKEIEELKKNQSRRDLPSFVKTNVSFKKRRGKKGPPFGHSFFSRRSPEEIDEEKEWILDICPDCGNEVSDSVESTKRMEIDIPPVVPVVTEHTIHRHWCPKCQKLVSPLVPSLLPSSPYGINLHLEVAYLKYRSGLTLEKIQALMAARYDLSLSTGLLSEMLTRVGERLGPVHKWLKEAINMESVLNADETGWRVAGINHWLWSFSSKELAYYHIDRSRGQKVVTLILGKSFAGVLISDFYNAYNLVISTKQKCWVHILRDVKKMEKDYPNDKEVLAFAKKIKMYFRRAMTLKSQWDQLEPEVFQKKAHRVKETIMNLTCTTSKNKSIRRLSRRLIKYRKELFVFLEKKEVPCHNNDAERQIRPTVLMRKTSYQNASDRGATTQSVFMSVIQTCRKKKIDFFEWTRQYLVASMAGTGPPRDPFSLSLPAP